jgi:hypothetical protein
MKSVVSKVILKAEENHNNKTYSSDFPSLRIYIVYVFHGLKIMSFNELWSIVSFDWSYPDLNFKNHFSNLLTT